MSEGTAAGTHLIRDINPGTSGSSASAGPFVEFNGAVYFGAFSGSSPGLWKTDGTEAGTVRIDVASVTSYPTLLTPSGDAMFFIAEGANHSSYVWKTDGTAAGTAPLTAFGTTGVDPLWMTAGEPGTVFFVNVDATGQQVWKSDGTVAGTAKVKTIKPATTVGSAPSGLTYHNGALYFTADDGVHGRELWKSDGTEAGTVMVKDVNPGIANGAGLVWVAAGAVYFAATDGALGTELWTTDGTEAGTVMVADLNPGAGGSAPSEVVATADGTVYFAADDGVHGRELWKIPQGVVVPLAEVVGRHVFYNHSAFDASEAADAADDSAVAGDKIALLPGQPATFASVTSYTRGINGVMIDVRNLPAGAGLSANDFVVRSGGSLAPVDLRAGPSDVTVSVRRGAGAAGSDRVTLTWPDYSPGGASAGAEAVGNGWLQVTVSANEDTGLAQADVFSFGNLIGETGDGNTAAELHVNAIDVAAVKRALSAAPATVSSRYDLNRDGRVNALDVAAVKQGLGRRLPLPASAAAIPVAAKSLPADTTAGATSLLRET